MIPSILHIPAAIYAAIAVTSVYRFGTVSLLDVPYANHDFVYTNSGNTTKVIERLQPSCNCTSAFIVSGSHVDAENLPYSIAPGTSVKVRVSVNLSMVPYGPVSRSASVFLQGQANPAATYTLDGTIEPGVHFTPDTLDFGTVQAGTSRTILVLVSVDNRLVPQDFPGLVADYPGVVINPVRKFYRGPAILKGVQPRREIDRLYNVTIPSGMALGRINATLSLDGGPTALPAAIAQYKANTGLISGFVQGTIKADPEAVSFGAVPSGQTSAQTVTLTGNTPADVNGMSVKSASPFLAVALSESYKKADPVRTLTITVTRTAPAGLFNTKIDVILANGQHLIIPAIGYVAGPG